MHVLYTAENYSRQIYECIRILIQSHDTPPKIFLHSCMYSYFYFDVECCPLSRRFEQLGISKVLGESLKEK